MRGILVASSPNDSFEKLYQKQPNDLIVGIDGGCEKIKSHPIDIAFGDFDSLKKHDLLKKIKEIKTFPIQKDETDLELAIDSLKDQVEEFIVYNATGGRLDHFLATLKLLERFKNLKIKVIDEKNEIMILPIGSYELIKNDYQYFSLIPVEDTMVSIEGALYNIKKRLVKKTDTFTVSNQIIDKTKIFIYQGLMFLILSKDA